MPDADETLVADIEAQAAFGKVFSRDVPMTGSPRYITFSGLYGDTFDRYANPESIPFETYNQMRYHGVLRAAMILVKAPILAAMQNATVQCKDPKIKRVVEHAFLESGLLYKLGKTALRAQEFGVSFHEKVWDVDDVELTYTDEDPDTGETIEDIAWSGPMHVFTELREVNPTTVRYILRDPQSRKFAGFVQAYAPTWIANAGAPTDITPSELAKLLPKGVDASALDGIPIVTQKAFVYTYQQEFGNKWGVARFKAAYPYYFWAQVMLKFWMSWAERKIVPPRIVRHPVGRAIDGTDFSDLAVMIGEAIDDVRSVAIPNSRMSEPGQWHGGDFQWQVEEVTTTDKSETFQNIINYLESGMLRSVFVPERTFTAGTGFSLYSTDAEAHTDTFLMTEDADAFDLINAINEDAVKPFVLDNFGADAEPATVEIPGLTDAHKELLKEIIMGILTTPGTPDEIDVRAILEQLNVPLKDVEPTPVGAPAADANAPLAGAPGSPPAVPAAAGSSVALPTGATGQNLPPAQPSGVPAAGGEAAPSNLVLDDALTALLVSLDTFDPTRWDVSPDPKALNGFRVVDKQDGRRITGFAAQQVVVAYQKYAQTQGKKSATAAKTAANKAAAEQKRQAKSAQTAAAKAQRTQTAAQKKAASDAAKAEKQQATAQKKDESAQQQHDHALASAVQKERNTIESSTSKMNPVDAIKALEQNGYKVQASADVSGYDALVQQATQLAKSDPDNIYTLVKVKGGYAMCSKPKAVVEQNLGVTATGKAANAPSNVALDAARGHAAGEVSAELLSEFEKKIRQHLRKGRAA